MQQLTLFSDSYFFDKQQKMEASMDKRFRALFALVTELQSEIIKIKSETNVPMQKLQ